jgi:flavin reductase (DIM6/NTAB) family NADH-FMN oxidoreductase RutF
VPQDGFSGHLKPQPALDAQPANQAQRELRDALGSFATGVCIVTARAADGRSIGLTCNSFSSISLDPPLVLWSLSRRSGILADFLQARHFVVNVLSAAQEPLSRRFADRLDRFSDVPCADGACGAPLIAGACAHFECSAEHVWDGGDHVIFVGRVIRHSHNGAEPLLYHRRQYRTLADARPAQSISAIRRKDAAR